MFCPTAEIYLFIIPASLHAMGYRGNILNQEKGSALALKFNRANIIYFATLDQDAMTWISIVYKECGHQVDEGFLAHFGWRPHSTTHTRLEWYFLLHIETTNIWAFFSQQVKEKRQFYWTRVKRAYQQQRKLCQGSFQRPTFQRAPPQIHRPTSCIHRQWAWWESSRKSPRKPLWFQSGRNPLLNIHGTTLLK